MCEADRRRAHHVVGMDEARLAALRSTLWLEAEAKALLHKVAVVRDAVARSTGLESGETLAQSPATTRRRGRAAGAWCGTASTSPPLRRVARAVRADRLALCPALAAGAKRRVREPQADLDLRLDDRGVEARVPDAELDVIGLRALH